MLEDDIIKSQHIELERALVKMLDVINSGDIEGGNELAKYICLMFEGNFKYEESFLKKN